MAKPNRPDLPEWAWTKLEEIKTQGCITLDNGTVVTLSPEHMVRVILELAKRKAKVPRSVNLPEDFNMAKTGG